MILPTVRDPRLITIRRGGTLTDADHRLLALWAAACAEHVLHLFESERPQDPRPRQAIEHARAWVRGEVPMMQARGYRFTTVSEGLNISLAGQDATGRYAEPSAGRGSASPLLGHIAIARSACAVIVSDGFTPRFAETAEPSTTESPG